MPYRPQGEFVGSGANKLLSAHTIASFMYLQGVSEYQHLRADAGMCARVLRGLLRKTAIEWWVNSTPPRRPGEPSWLAFDRSSMNLTLMSQEVV